MKSQSNEDLLNKIQNIVIARGQNDPDYPIERHLEDMDFIADLTELKRKIKKKAT